MKGAAEYIGIAIVILSISFGIAHCDRTNAEIEMIRAQAKAIEKGK